MRSQDAISALKARVDELDKQIVDNDAKDYLLGLARSWIRDVEMRVPGAEFMPPLIDQQIRQAENAVSKYGRNLRIIG